MMPGMGGKGMSARQMNSMMRRLGIQVKDIPDVQEVRIYTTTKVYTFRDAEVTVMDAQGSKTYQLAGKATVRDITPEERTMTAGAAGPPAAAPELDDEEALPSAEEQLAAVAIEISDEDVALVASQTGKPPKQARAALEAAKGDIAEAIVKLSE